MSHTAKELLIIYEAEAEQWVTYLKSVFSGPISETGICCFDIATVSSWRAEFLRLAQYSCKLLILSKGMTEGLCQKQRLFLARVLSPAAHVVVLLCGVNSLAPLLELVPLDGNKCLQISSEQNAHEYLSTVTDIVRKGVLMAEPNVSPLTCKALQSEQTVGRMPSNGAPSVRCSVVVLPSRVPCGSPAELFFLLKNDGAGSQAELEFASNSHTLRVTPVHWNDRTLRVNAPDFSAGDVSVTVYSDGVPLGTAQLQYYSMMEEVTCLLSRVVDPVEFMCQAFHVSSVEKLDQKLARMLLEAMPTGNTSERELQHADAPSLLHFAAQFGLKSVSSLLLQCPGAEQALHTANRHGHTPTEIAESHGHAELHVLLKETLSMFHSSKDNGDASVYEMMCTAGNGQSVHQAEDEEGEEEEEEDVYAPLGESDEYDTIVNSAKAGVIANRPPAPTPRPESTRVKGDKIPYIAQVFQKKKKKKKTTTPQGDADLYSLPTKQARERGDSVSPAYDTFMPDKVQQRARPGPLAADDALRQQVQRRIDANQQQKLSQQRASAINSKEGDDGVYDKINTAHHMPSAGGRGRSQQVEADFYSTPHKGQQVNSFWKGDKR